MHGGLFALAMARGSGKSSIAEVACIWAVLYGHRNFVCLIGSDEGHACDMLDSIKTELDSNELLLADFPEVCFPIHALDGISNRAQMVSSIKANARRSDGPQRRLCCQQLKVAVPVARLSKSPALRGASEV